MNTFTFTDDEVEAILSLIERSRGINERRQLLLVKDKLERKPVKYSGGGVIRPSAPYLVHEDGPITHMNRKDHFKPKEKLGREHTNHGTTFSISTEAPETFDKAGFDALEFTEISEVIRSKEK